MSKAKAVVASSKWAVIFLGITLSLFSVIALLLSLFKFYAVDEFQYGHAAWMVHQGKVPFVDFFDHHFPLIYQLFSPIFALDASTADYLRYMRLCMLPFIAMIIGSVFVICQRERRKEAIWATLLILSNFTLMNRVVEIRPDTIAIALLISAMACLYPTYSPRLKGWLQGFLLVLAIWASQKALVYGIPFALLYIIDFVRFHRARPTLMGNPYFVILGSLCALLTFPLALFSEGAYTAWFQSCIIWPMEHEREASGFSWWSDFLSILSQFYWQVPLCLSGIFAIASQRYKAKSLYHPDSLLLVLLPLTFFSYRMQKAPYLYSLIPFFICAAMSSGIGIMFLARQFSQGGALRLFKPIGFALLLGLIWFQLLAFLGNFHGQSYQHNMLDVVEHLTQRDDPIYENSAHTLTHPSIHYYYFTNAFLRQHNADRLTKEIPGAVKAEECTYYFHDLRFYSLPNSLKIYIGSHFFPCEGELWVYGKKLTKGNQSQTFDAVRGGKYFISPETSVAQVRVDGQPLQEQIFTLDKGPHQIQNESASSVHILYLPANGRVFTPGPIAKPRFSIY